MITDHDNRWHYLAVKSLPALLRGTTSKHHEDFYCLNCFHSYHTLTKINTNPANSYTEKKAEDKSSGYAWCSICSFNDTKNRRYFYREKYCTKKFCKDLKELGTELINFQKKEMMPLTDKEIKSYEKQKVCHICKKKFCNNKNKKKLETIAITPENVEQLLILNAI